MFGIFFTGIIMHYIVNTPVKMVMDGLTHWLESLGTGNLVLMGIIFSWYDGN
ncbi:hypothetical protein BsIDN1_25750 [Bacillus safensis]|uniref:Uncharacterized protein n=1 Tax=Bacillus safensis TaxID=561879 RepID=A0A5S9M618_BACIA|nr:hypothetical protein BsIDN1_25750 [Bacillus safensis]